MDQTISSYSQVYLTHHGILGQKWGKMNGPPYPLDESGHSGSEKKAGWKKSLNKSTKDKKSTSSDSRRSNADKNKSSEKRGLTDGQKRAIKIGAIAVATAVVAIGAYKLNESGKLDSSIEKGKDIVNSLLGSKNRADIPDTLKSTISKLNPDGSDTNCRACSVGGILRMRGMNVVARGDVPVGETAEIVRDCFKGGIVDTIDPTKTDPIEFISKKYGPGSSGIFSGGFQTETGFFGHAIGWTVDSKGKVNFFDGQSGKISVNDMVEDRLLGLFKADISRLDNLEINQDALEKYFRRG